MARKLKIPRQHLCDIEKGRRQVSAERAAQFARLLGYSDRGGLTVTLLTYCADGKRAFFKDIKTQDAVIRNLRDRR